MQPRAWFQCIKGCPGELPLTDIVYECPRCGALLEVAHDLGELKKQSSAYWTRTFDARYKRTTWPYGSGVWGKKEWVAPHVSDDNVVSLDEGVHLHQLRVAKIIIDVANGKLPERKIVINKALYDQLVSQPELASVEKA